MNLRALSLSILGLAMLAGCTTISRQAQLSDPQVVSSILPIKSLADDLVERFSERGWIIKVDRHQQASKWAGLVMRGWRKPAEVSKADPTQTWLDRLAGTEEPALIRTAVIGEIQLATQETENLNQQVEHFSSQQRSFHHLRTEMLSLEQAVLATSRAKKLFVSATENQGMMDTDTQNALFAFDQQIEHLISQTDALNDMRKTKAVG